METSNKKCNKKQKSLIVKLHTIAQLLCPSVVRLGSCKTTRPFAEHVLCCTAQIIHHSSPRFSSFSLHSLPDIAHVYTNGFLHPQSPTLKVHQTAPMHRSGPFNMLSSRSFTAPYRVCAAVCDIRRTANENSNRLTTAEGVFSGITLSPSPIMVQIIS